MVENEKKNHRKEPSNQSLSHELGSEQSERASERVSERSKQGRESEQVIGASEQTNRRASRPVLTFIRLESWLFWTIVPR